MNDGIWQAYIDGLTMGSPSDHMSDIRDAFIEIREYAKQLEARIENLEAPPTDSAIDGGDPGFNYL